VHGIPLGRGSQPKCTYKYEVQGSRVIRYHSDQSIMDFMKAWKEECRRDRERGGNSSLLFDTRVLLLTKGPLTEFSGA
jgi:hypothetical protein